MAMNSKCTAKNPATCRFHHPNEVRGTVEERRGQQHIFLGQDQQPKTPLRQAERFTLQGSLPSRMNTNTYQQRFNRLAKTLDAKTCVTEMREAGNTNWGQTEWAGWYFEHWAALNLPAQFAMRDTLSTAKKTWFDAHFDHPWDLKVHTLRNAAGKRKNTVILNDKADIEAALEFHGRIGLLVVNGEATFDDEFKNWRIAQRGGLSDTQKVNRELGKPSRALKNTFTPQTVDMYVITKHDAEALWAENILTVFKQPKQADHMTVRAPKMEINLLHLSPTRSFLLRNRCNSRPIRLLTRQPSCSTFFT